MTHHGSVSKDEEDAELERLEAVDSDAAKKVRELFEAFSGPADQLAEEAINHPCNGDGNTPTLARKLQAALVHAYVHGYQAGERQAITDFETRFLALIAKKETIR